MKTSTVVTASAATLVSVSVACALYFDYRRRNEATLRKTLRKQRKERAAHPTSSASVPRTSAERAAALDRAYAEFKRAEREEDKTPKDLAALRSYFDRHVALGETLSAAGPAAHYDAAVAFMRALRVYAEPLELLEIYSRALGKGVYAIVMELIARDVVENTAGGAGAGAAVASLASGSDAAAPGGGSAELDKKDGDRSAPVVASASATAAPEVTATSGAGAVTEKAVQKPEPPKGRRSTVGKRILVLISGSGSNFQALIDATIPSLRTSGQPHIPNAQIVGVISNRKAAFGLERARVADPPIPAEVFSLQSFRKAHPGQGRDEYDEALARMCAGYTPDVIVLAGFMHIVSPRFLRVLGHASASLGPGLPEMEGRRRSPVPIINLHPALPGQFDGAGAIERAFEAFKAGTITQTGVMVHEVIAEVDRGAPVLVERIEMAGVERIEELEERIHTVEHRLIVEGTRKVLERPLGAEGRK